MIDYELIGDKVTELRRCYGNADPREILADKGAALLEMAMGKEENSIKGFIVKNSRMVTVGINTDLPEAAVNKVLFHETGHLCLGHLNGFRSGALRDTSFGYRSDGTRLSRFENEANFFASEYILDTEETLAAVREYDLFSAARFLHVPVEFLDYKLRFLSCRGIFPGYRDLLSVKSDCMRNMKLADGSYDQGH